MRGVARSRRRAAPPRRRVGIERGAVGDDDGAEVLRVDRPGLSFGERGGGVGGDPDAGFAVARFEDVGAVSRGGHPGADDRLGGGEPEGAPGDVLAHEVPILGGGDVAAGADPIERGFTARSGVGEVVAGGHVRTVVLGGVGELGVGDQCALTVAFAFLIDQAQHRSAQERDVARLGGQARVGAGARDGDGGECRKRHERAQAPGQGEQRRRTGTCHISCIGPTAGKPERGRGGLDTFVLQREHAPQGLPHDL